MNRKTSVIWDYFTVIESDKAKHIKSKHPTTDLSKRSRPNFDVKENNPDDPPSNNGNLSASTSSNSGVVSTSTSNRDRSPLFHRQPSSSIRPQQCQISNYFSKPVTVSKRQLIDQQVIKMIVKEYYPFSIVEDVEFIKLVNMLNPGYSLPSRKTLSTSLLPVLYNEIYKKVQSDIEVNAQYVALTTDAWTSLKNESYTAITVHFIDQNCELKSY
ncbi:zinc finger BED domain-containing protein 6-like [Melanaphis sacchari]|uniref:zinc finger BED domain-containing protein 6-like n=1 Tax=Melanaphis sacchari TaxID=742174 RepID=UPI000DC14CFC|nr:zinc finger BED domain-containing protein 6-like [Melanaphis sacchari]